MQGIQDDEADETREQANLCRDRKERRRKTGEFFLSFLEQLLSEIIITSSGILYM